MNFIQVLGNAIICGMIAGVIMSVEILGGRQVENAWPFFQAIFVGEEIIFIMFVASKFNITTMCLSLVAEVVVIGVFGYINMVKE